MSMSAAYITLIGTAGKNAITHIGLVNASGTELSGGSYARKAVTWGTESSGSWHMSADLTFDVPAGATVGGWRGFSALTAGTNYGGADLTQESFASAGQYVLQASSTALNHNAS